MSLDIDWTILNKEVYVLSADLARDSLLKILKILNDGKNVQLLR